MIPTYLRDLLPPEEAKQRFLPLYRTRAQAAEWYRRRRQHVNGLAFQVEAGLWRSPAVGSLIRNARCDHDLLWRQRDAFVEANGGRHDLDISYRPRIPESAASVTEADLLTVVAALESLAPASETAPIRLESAIWTDALRLEGLAYLSALLGDWYLEQALSDLEMLVERLREPLTRLGPYDSETIQIHAAIITLYGDLGLPAQVEAAFQAFRAAYDEGGGDVFPWRERLQSDRALASRTAGWFGQVLRAVIDVQALRHPSDRTKLELLESLREVYLPPMVRLPDPPPFQVSLPTVDTLEDADGALSRIVQAYGQEGARSMGVLRLWQGFVRSSLYRFRGVLGALDGVAADDEALGILSHTLCGEAHYRLAAYEGARHQLRSAEEFAGAALTRAEDAAWSGELTRSRLFAAGLAQLAGNAAFAVGDKTTAQRAYERARCLAEDDPLAQATYLLNLGNLAYLRDNLVDYRGYLTLDWGEMHQLARVGPDALGTLKVQRNASSLSEAEGYYRSALNQLSRVDRGDQQAQELIATAHLDLGNTAWAWARVIEEEGATRLSDLTVGETKLTLLASDATLVDCYRTAIEQYQRALRITRGQAVIEATCRVNLSEMCYLLAEKTGAAPWLRQGLAAGERALALTDDPLGTGYGDRVIDPGIQLPEGTWRAHHNLARLHQACGDEQAARDHYERAIEALEHLRRGIRLEAWQATSLQEKLQVYEDYVGFLYHQDPVAHLERLWALFERTKARAFLDLLERTDLDIALPPALVERRDDLLARIGACNDDMRRALGENGLERVALLRERQEAYAGEWKEVQSQILAAQGADPELSPPLLSLADVQQMLAGRDAVLLSYLVGVRHSYLMVVDSDQAHLFELPGRREIEGCVTRLLWYCQQNSRRSFLSFRTANVEAVELLLGPAERALGLVQVLRGREVVVVPDGVLFYLPFEALLVDGGHEDKVAKDADFGALRPYYLIARSDVSYLPSASAWPYLLGRRLPPTSVSALGAYNIHYDVDEPRRPAWTLAVLAQLRDLPGTRGVGQLLEAFKARWPQQGVVHLRAWRDDDETELPAFQSTEGNFVRLVNACRPRYIVFAGHAVYNDQYPSLSGLVFNLGPVPGAGEVSLGRQDGFLRLGEVWRLDLRHTELTFLAACQTGLGAVYRGEGLMALTRAFMYQGSRAVVASLWAVSDNATQALTGDFFSRLLAQPDADRAHLLAEAKRALLRDERTCLPWYWAPFTLTGARCPAP